MTAIKTDSLRQVSGKGKVARIIVTQGLYDSKWIKGIPPDQIKNFLVCVYNDADDDYLPDPAKKEFYNPTILESFKQMNILKPLNERIHAHGLARERFIEKSYLDYKTFDNFTDAEQQFLTFANFHCGKKLEKIKFGKSGLEFPGDD